MNFFPPKKEKDEYDNLLPVAKICETATAELNSVKQTIKEINEKIRKTELKPSIETKLADLATAFKGTAGEKEFLKRS